MREALAGGPRVPTCLHLQSVFLNPKCEDKWFSLTLHRPLEEYILTVQTSKEKMTAPVLMNSGVQRCTLKVMSKQPHANLD